MRRLADPKDGSNLERGLKGERKMPDTGSRKIVIAEYAQVDLYP